MKYEKTKKGNPNRLTICQHTFPAASINRFTRNGSVEVKRIRKSKSFLLKPDNQLFCAKRVWNQSIESGFMKTIEDSYQILAEQILGEWRMQGNIKHLNNDEQDIITNMYLLWNIRDHRKRNLLENQKIGEQKTESCIETLSTQRDYNPNDLEIFEKNGIGVVRSDLTISNRDINQITIQLEIFKAKEKMKRDGIQWGILKATEGQFIVPDNFSKATILPLFPSICFFSKSKNDCIGKKEVCEINKLAIESSREYYFAKSIDDCPK
ncbi:hypothetical protein [Candidatus Albibeggiatoa sp. nov. NOAA]|uniref:hypothetical protein n=1 Tax=Candidatus Albibeggiatoa sp. nov. NOAA TaxID=3162724 RepID=UPI0033051053|nr:hypothetical protein [Thiotrichaceae bacterium]